MVECTAHPAAANWSTRPETVAQPAMGGNLQAYIVHSRQGLPDIAEVPSCRESKRYPPAHQPFDIQLRACRAFYRNGHNTTYPASIGVDGGAVRAHSLLSYMQFLRDPQGMLFAVYYSWFPPSCVFSNFAPHLSQARCPMRTASPHLAQKSHNNPGDISLLMSSAGGRLAILCRLPAKSRP